MSGSGGLRIFTGGCPEQQLPEQSLGYPGENAEHYTSIAVVPQWHYLSIAVTGNLHALQF